MSKNLVVSVVVVLIFVAGIYFVNKNAKPLQKPVVQDSMELNSIEGENMPVEGEVEKEGDFVMQKVQDGSGDIMSKDGDTLGVKYVGYLEDGTSFDSNIDAETDFEFVLGSKQVIPGWDMGLKDMKVGEVRKLVIPPAFAYGDAQIGLIPPNSTLFFEVELKSIK